MNTIQHLRKLGQSLWLDSISRQMLDDGRLQRYVTELQVTGLTSNPTIFDEAIGSGGYDADIARMTREGKSGEALFTADSTTRHPRPRSASTLAANGCGTTSGR